MLMLKEWSWCPHVRIFLSTPLSLNMWTYFWFWLFAWGQARSKLGGVDTSILHHAFISILGCYYTLCHNTYAYSLLFYKVYMKRENAGSWNSGLEKEQILETYSTQLQKSWNFTEAIFGINKKYWRKNPQEGAHTLATRVGVRPTPGCAPYLMGPWQASGAHLLLYEVFRPRKKS